MKRLMHGLTAITVVAVVLLSGWGGATSTTAAAGGGTALPASASPHGYTLADMTRALALFSTSGNDMTYYPNTPFQILYADPANVHSDYVTRTGSEGFAPCPGGVPTVGCGWFSTQNTGAYSNTFRVRPGTMFYVPLWNADDSPPVVGTWPTTARQAGPYFFAASQLGAQGFTIKVDGSTVPIGPAYVGGPVETAQLLDGGGTHMITLGAFLGPMTPGTHTVEITGGVYGQAVKTTYEQAYGFSFAAQDFTYQVTVTKVA